MTNANEAKTAVEQPLVVNGTTHGGVVGVTRIAIVAELCAHLTYLAICLALLSAAGDNTGSRWGLESRGGVVSAKVTTRV